MDEPFSALDYITRLRMRQELARLLHERPRHRGSGHPRHRGGGAAGGSVIVLSGRPGRIRSERSLFVPRPRELTHPEVVEAIHGVLVELGLERRERSRSRRMPPRIGAVRTDVRRTENR